MKKKHNDNQISKIKITSYTVFFKHLKAQHHHFMSCVNLTIVSITSKVFTKFLSQVLVTTNFSIQMHNNAYTPS